MRTEDNGSDTDLYDVSDDLSRTDEEGHGRPKQTPRQVQADLVAVELGDVVCSLTRAAPARARRGRAGLAPRRWAPGAQRPAPPRNATLCKRAMSVSYPLSSRAPRVSLVCMCVCEYL